jgi:hypothetical protein
LIPILTGMGLKILVTVTSGPEPVFFNRLGYKTKENSVLPCKASARDKLLFMRLQNK